MKKSIVCVFVVSFILTTAPGAMGVGCKLVYKLKPGQTWICNFSSRNEMNVMGQDDVNQSRQVYEYRISKGPKNGWVTVTARIKTKASPDQGGMDFSKLVYTAVMHTSGEFRNIKYTGNHMPVLGEGAEDMPEEMKKMMEASYKMIPEAFKHSVFWFPEVPEFDLEIGDEFDVKRKMGMGGSGAGMQMETLQIQVFTLEDVSKDLAYFSVKERSVTKSEGIAGGQSKTKTAGKGEAIFDLEQGMWLELTEKSRANVNISGMAGLGESDQKMNTILKFEMELK